MSEYFHVQIPQKYKHWHECTRQPQPETTKLFICYVVAHTPSLCTINVRCYLSCNQQCERTIYVSILLFCPILASSSPTSSIYHQHDIAGSWADMSSAGTVGEVWKVTRAESKDENWEDKYCRVGPHPQGDIFLL